MSATIIQNRPLTRLPHQVTLRRLVARAAASPPPIPPSAREVVWSTTPATRTPTPVKRRTFQPTGDASKDLAVSLAMIADDIKGTDILLLNVSTCINWASYFLIVTAMNRPQMQAMIYKMEKEARDKFSRTLELNPSSKSEWELMDFGDVIIHVMTPQQRDYYDLESFYAAASEVTWDE